jgi:hypothetical protein
VGAEGGGQTQAKSLAGLEFCQRELPPEKDGNTRTVLTGTVQGWV